MFNLNQPPTINKKESYKDYVPIQTALLERNNLLPGDKDRIEKIKEAGETQSNSSSITSLNEKQKYSEGYRMCTGLIAVGKSKDDNKEISFLTHDFVPSVYREFKKQWIQKEDWDKKLNEYKSNLGKALMDFNEKVDPKSIDVIIFGGEASGNKYIFKSNEWKGYEDAVNYNNSLVKDILKITPTVIVGPQESKGVGKTDVYFDTEHRRLYMVRDTQKSERNENYFPEEFNDQIKKW